jgi:hypothetical protein
MIAVNTKAAVIGISETWLDCTISNPEIEIPGYTIERCDRNRNGGGVCIFVRSDLTYNKREDIESPELESIWVEILLPKSKPIVTGICYRPPKDNNFFDKLEHVLCNCKRLSDLECIILGDFNVNYLDSKNVHGLKKAVINFCNMFSLKQMIKEATRVSQYSNSLLDLIFVSDHHKISQSGVINVGLSDHCLIYCTRKVKKEQFKKHNSIRMRSLKNYSVENLNNKLNEVNWFDIINCDTVEVAWARFKTIFCNILDELAPVKSVRLKQRSEPWINSEILELIRERDKSFQKFKKHGDNINYTNFTKLRNKVQSKIRHAKKQYYINKIDEHKHEPKKLWNTIKTLGTAKTTKAKASNIGLEINGEINFDKTCVGEKFNNFFTTIASKLVDQIPRSQGKYNNEFLNQYYKNKGVLPDSFSLSLQSVKMRCPTYLINSVPVRQLVLIISLHDSFVTVPIN